MKNINKKSISLSLKVLSILAFGLIFVPFNIASASSYGINYVYNSGTGSNQNQTETNNPKPSISSINPKSSNVGDSTRTITVFGDGFIPSSIVRVNNSNRPTTFIDSSHLLVKITDNDTYAYETNGEFYITVFNRAPGGGYSNAVVFTVNKVIAPVANTSNGNTSPKTTQTENKTNNDAKSNYSNLASNAIFGSNSFLPSGLIQWVIFAIIILLIIIFARKVFGAEKNYHEAPMKHA